LTQPGRMHLPLFSISSDNGASLSLSIELAGAQGGQIQPRCGQIWRRWHTGRLDLAPARADPAVVTTRIQRFRESAKRVMKYDFTLTKIIREGTPSRINSHDNRHTKITFL
jgi:hypothetical protein